jgi:ribokinase
VTAVDGTAEPAGLDLLVIGDVDADVYVSSPRPPARGEKVLGTLLGVYAGGMAANVACAAARLGLRAGIVSRIGDDALGRFALDYFAELGVDARWVEVCDDIKTYVGAITIHEDGEKSIVVADGGALFPSPEGLRDVSFAGVRAVHIVPFDVQGALEAARRAKSSGCLLSVDLERTMVDGARALVDLVALTDILFCNHFTAVSLGGSVDEGMSMLRAMGAGMVVMTAGDQGATLSFDDELTRLPAAPATVVDASGAGDCFAAGFLLATLRGDTRQDAARCAAEVAAQAIGVVGGSHGVQLIGTGDLNA